MTSWVRRFGTRCRKTPPRWTASCSAGCSASCRPLAQLLLAGNRLAAPRVRVSAGRVHENPDQVALWTPGVKAAYTALA